MNLDRRQFLFTLGAATVTLRTALRAAEPAPAHPGLDIPWHQHLRRVGQVNFNERDPVELDVAAWADTWADLRVDAVLVSVTGIIAFYPTAVPFHRRSRFLGERDLFAECCAAGKHRGIRVIARLSPDLQWKEALDAHPEWFRHDAEGRPTPHTPVPGLFNTCPFSTYYSEQIPAIMREINARYDVDGLFTNAWPILADPPECHCPACQNAPKAGTPAFQERHLRRTLELWRLYSAIAREKHPDNVFYGNLGWGVGAQTNLKELASECVWFNCDNQGREGEASPAWLCTQQGRVARAVMQGRTITSVIGSYATGKIRWRNTAKNEPEATLWMAQTTASGMRIWYHWLGGQTGLGEDHRWIKAGRDFLQWQARHDEHFTYRRSLANVGVVWSQRSNAHYAPPGASTEQRHGYPEFVLSLYALLLEGRFFFDFVHEDDLGPERLRQYDVLLLPNVATLSDAQVAQLRAYAAAGGSLVATFETGLYDENGTARADFALGDVFGVSRLSEIQGPVANYGWYARIEQRHEILRGFEQTNWLPGGQYAVPVRAIDASVPLTVVRANSGYPPEMAYSPESHTDQPALVLREAGNSRRAYFAGDCERSAWRSGNTDLAQVFLSAIRWALRDRAAVAVRGDGFIEAFAWETDPGYAVHLLNYNNPHLHRGWIRKQYPIGAQKISLALPAGRRVARAQLLRAETNLPFAQNGDIVEFTVPGVVDYEVAALILA
ncbi:MAG TPA: alpha-amylase family protein [Opitutaceae bacterium]|nr:alpha-amylase family protein [Opitutaceae bacterium]